MKFFYFSFEILIETVICGCAVQSFVPYSYKSGEPLNHNQGFSPISCFQLFHSAEAGYETNPSFPLGTNLLTV